MPRKRSLTVSGHRTSVSLEAPFWEVLARIAHGRGLSVQSLVAELDRGRRGPNLSSALRTFVLAEALRGAVPPQRAVPPQTAGDQGPPLPPTAPKT